MSHESTFIWMFTVNCIWRIGVSVLCVFEIPVYYVD